MNRVQRFVLVSTDKAVRPTNVMGASKRLTEMLMQAYAAPSCPLSEDDTATFRTIFMAVRFGNVLGSSGSVIPLFKRQIERGGPVSVTHPEINRYFMSIEEAAQLILQAGAMGQGGELFLLKMGKPIKIADMARQLIKLSGRIPDVEIKIQYTGLREGEKLYEELITDGEGIVETGHEKIMVLRGVQEEHNRLLNGIEKLREKADEQDTKGIKDIMQELIPEYTPDYETKGNLSTKNRETNALHEEK
ncbi:MAG: polysaccharide biosynthesis protein, partial [Candidatus Electrothrix sp. MAN1_4]|nr:polysaccharide biosynthesis protein [Candidatus Electrothrix sp. MAN1_4]